MAIIVKPGVVFCKLEKEIYDIFHLLEQVWNQFAPGMEPTITSANDSKHMENSLHYRNLAIDLRTKNLPKLVIKDILFALGSNLEPIGYDVLLEGLDTDKEHFHIEYDRRKDIIL